MPDPEIHPEEGPHTGYYERSFASVSETEGCVKGGGCGPQHEHHTQPSPSTDNDLDYRMNRNPPQPNNAEEVLEQATDDAVHALTSLSEPFVLDKGLGSAAMPAASPVPVGIKEGIVDRMLSSDAESGNLYLPPPSLSSRQSPSALCQYRTTATPSPTVLSSTLSASSATSSSHSSAVMRDLRGHDTNAPPPAPVPGTTRLPPLQSTLSSSVGPRHSPPARLQSLSVLLKDRLSLASLQSSAHSQGSISLPPLRAPTDEEGMAQGHDNRAHFPSPASPGIDQDQRIKQQQQLQQHLQAPRPQPLLHQQEDPRPLLRSLSSPTLHQQKMLSTAETMSAARDTGYARQDSRLMSPPDPSSQDAGGMVKHWESQRTTSPIPFPSHLNHHHNTNSTNSSSTHHQNTQSTAPMPTPMQPQLIPAIPQRSSLEETRLTPHSGLSAEPMDHLHHHHALIPQQRRSNHILTFDNQHKAKRKNGKRAMSTGSALSTGAFGAPPPNALPIDTATLMGKNAEGNELMLSDRGLLLKTQIPKKGRPITKHTSVATSVTTAHILTSPLPTSTNAALAGIGATTTTATAVAGPSTLTNGRPRHYPTGHQHHPRAAGGEQPLPLSQQQQSPHMPHQPIRRRPGRPPLSASLSSPALIKRDSSSYSKASYFGDAGHLHRPIGSTTANSTTLPLTNSVSLTRMRPPPLQIAAIGRPPPSPGIYPHGQGTFDFTGRPPAPPSGGGNRPPTTPTTTTTTGQASWTHHDVTHQGTETVASFNSNGIYHSQMDDHPPYSTENAGDRAPTPYHTATTTPSLPASQVESEHSPIPSLFAEGHHVALNTDRRIPLHETTVSTNTACANHPPLPPGQRKSSGDTSYPYTDGPSHSQWPTPPHHQQHSSFSPSSSGISHGQGSGNISSRSLTHLHSRSLDSLAAYQTPHPIDAPPPPPGYPTSPSFPHEQHRLTSQSGNVQHHHQKLQHEQQHQLQHHLQHHRRSMEDTRSIAMTPNLRASGSISDGALSHRITHDHIKHLEEHHPSSPPPWERGVVSASDSGYGPEWDASSYDPRRATWSDPYMAQKEHASLEQQQQRQQKQHHQHHYQLKQQQPLPIYECNRRQSMESIGESSGNMGHGGSRVKRHEILQQQPPQAMAPEQHEYDRPGSHSDSGYEHVNYATGNHQGRSGTSADPSSALSDQHRRGSNVSSISSVSASSTIVTTHQGIDNIKRSDSKPHYPPILLRPVSLSALHQYANEVQSGGGTDGQRSLYSQCHPQQQRQQHYEEDDRLSGGDGGERRRGSRGSGLATNGGGGYYDTFADTTGPMGPPPPGQPLYLAHRAPSPSTLSSTTTAATGTAMHHQIQHQHPFTHSPPPLSATSTSSALSMQTDMTGSTSVSGGSSAACTATLSMGTGVGTGTATNGIHSLINRKRKSGEIDSASGLSRPPSSASLRGSFKVGDLSHDRHEDGREDEEEEERDAQYRLQRQYHHSTLYHYPGDKRFGPDAECGGEAGEEVTHEDRKNSRGGQNEDDDVLSETQGLSPLAAPKKKAAYHRHSLSQPISSMQTPKHGHHPQHQHHHQSTHDTPHFPYPPQQENQHQHQQEQAPSSDVASQQYSQYQRYQQPHPVHHHHHHPSLPPSQMIAAREPAYTSTMVYPPSSRPHLPPYHS